jgi:hypothetical protein
MDDLYFTTVHLLTIVTALTGATDTHTKGHDMQPNTDSTHRKGQH